MRYNVALAALVMFCSSFLQAQNIETLFNQKRYAEIAKRGETPKTLTGKELFQVAQAHLKLQNDSLAIFYAGLAEKKGYISSDLYYAKAIAHNNLEEYSAAITTLNTGLLIEPNRKTLLLEKAAAEYKAGRLDDAKTTYTTISRLFEGNQLANFMICQIQYEIQPSATAARCFWDVLHFFPDKNQFYQQALENIAAIEFFTLNNFVGAEKTYQRLLLEFPNNAQYHAALTQLYHFSGQYTLGTKQMDAIQVAWYNRLFTNETYRAGMVQVDGFADQILRAEAFWSPIKDQTDKPTYVFFIFSVNATRSLGKIAVFRAPDGATISGYGFEEPLNLPEVMAYEQIKQQVINTLNMNAASFKP